jgi:hypothetical protein
LPELKSSALLFTLIICFKQKERVYVCDNII